MRSLAAAVLLLAELIWLSVVGSTNAAELEPALSGRVRAHDRFLITAHFSQLDFLAAQIATFDARIAQHLQSQPLPAAAQTTNGSSPKQPDSTSES